MSGVNVIQSLARLNNGNRKSKFGCVLLEIHSPVRTASVMGHWKRMIKITGDTDLLLLLYN